MRRITVGTVRISERAKELIAEVLSANRISGGKYVAELEKNIASYHGVSHAVAVNTGTAADEIALSVCYDFKADRGDDLHTQCALGSHGDGPLFRSSQPVMERHCRH